MFPVRLSCATSLSAWLVSAAVCPGAMAEMAPQSVVRGVVRAEASATISSELVARISSLPYKAGQAFKAGDVLVTFDCRRYEADLRAAEAEVRSLEIAVVTNRQLLRHGATGSNDLAVAEAKHNQAVATADLLRVRTSQCRIDSPYDGQVVQLLVDVFEMPQANAPLMKIVKTGRLEVDMIVPSEWATWLKSGYAFSFKVDETGTKHDARILQTGAVVDPVSRTMKVAAILIAPSPLVRPGMSGAASFAAPAGDKR